MAVDVVLQTEYEFTLPRGYVDQRGNLHRHGTMRLAIALDEIEPLLDPRVQANQAYLGVLLLSRVVVRLGDLSPVPPTVVEQMFSADFAILQDFYIRINDFDDSLVETQCPRCSHRFALDLAVSHS